MITLTQISRSCGAFAGIYPQVYLQSAAALSATPPHSLGVLLTQAVPAGFVEYDFERSSLDYQTKDKKSEAGITTEQYFQGFILKSSLANLQSLELLKKVQDPIVVFKDKNGIFRLIGSKNAPATSIITEMVGRKTGERNGFEVSFSATIPDIYYSYTGTLPTPAEV